LNSRCLLIKLSSTDIFIGHEIGYSFFFSFRKLEKITKFIEENKEKFTQLDLQDVKVRENLKHAKSKAKKLEKQLQKDKEKVVWTATS